MERTKPLLWQSIVKRITNEETAGTKAGQWSARKAQMAVKEYKKMGGEYTTTKSDNNSLVKWSNQHWKTKSGKPSSETGERYLPEKAIEALTSNQYKQTSEVKKKDMTEGKQFSKQPKNIAEIVREYRTI
jgi:hypothetical protein